MFPQCGRWRARRDGVWLLVVIATVSTLVSLHLGDRLSWFASKPEVKELNRDEERLLDDQRSLGDNEAPYVTRDNQVISDVTRISHRNSSYPDLGLNNSGLHNIESSTRITGGDGSHIGAAHPHHPDPDTRNSDTSNPAGAGTPTLSAGPSQPPGLEPYPVPRYFENLPGPNTTQSHQTGTPPLHDWLTQGHVYVLSYLHFLDSFSEKGTKPGAIRSNNANFIGSLCHC
ncbi:uncharacterized protein LOC131953321 [Physella acuta]|uniref:uncharacterized protein LOC131953321 n=1 Tax=Physella acuta TaxID=109671 RepID=UPI0027DADFAA|nr:uncharacterized protein LOC131953321 [Physella acuta]